MAQGSGFIVALGEEAVVVTAGHVLEEMCRCARRGAAVRAFSMTGPTGKATPIDLDRLEICGSRGFDDLGLVRLGPVQEVHRALAAPRFGRSTTVGDGDACDLIGFPMDFAPTLLSARTRVCRACTVDHSYEDAEEADSTRFLHASWPRTACTVEEGASAVTRLLVDRFPAGDAMSGGPVCVGDQVVGLTITENFGHAGKRCDIDQCVHCVIGLPFERWVEWAGDPRLPRVNASITQSQPLAPDRDAGDIEL